MTVLSDTEIMDRIQRGELVPGGDLTRALECSYSFVPGRAFHAGSKEEPIDFPGPTGSAQLVVEPGRMIWIRTRDRVRIPADLVGFWWQTNTLSRKGLMLVNMSMVEPGYEGDLACLFVNFGNGRVLIDARTVIAKMVFVHVEGTVARPFNGRKSTQDYDFDLNQLAIAQPSSFLQVGELAVDLKSRTDEAVREIEAAGSNVKIEADKDLSLARTEALKAFRDDIPGTVRKSAGWALAALALLTAAGLLAEWIKGNVFPDPKAVARAEAQDVLGERVTLSGTADSAENAALRRRVDELNARLRRLEARR